MFVVFVDDSKTQARRAHLGELVAVGAAFVPEASVASYAQDLQALRQELGIPAEQELKWKPAKGSFLATAGGEVATALRRGMLQAAAAREIKTAVVVWDRGHLNQERELIEPQILGYLYERIELFLQERGERGVVIADMPGGGGADHNRWLSDARALAEAGTRYTTPERVLLPMITTPSHHAPHLQLADLVTAATTAAIAGYPAGPGLVDLLKPLARTYRGVIGGAGLVLWPRDIRDLCYWVFGDTHDSKGVPLGPSASGFDQPGRTYQGDDGMPPTVPDTLTAEQNGQRRAGR
jgi:hypothetical protein